MLGMGVQGTGMSLLVHAWPWHGMAWAMGFSCMAWHVHQFA